MNSLEPAARNEAVERVVRLASASHPEFVDLEHAKDRILAEDLFAERDHPPFNRATMDGYAVRAQDIQPGRSHPVTGDVPAGHEHREAVPEMACVSIATGAAVPAELDAVIEHERSNRENPVRFEIDSVEPGRNIHPRGVDRSRGAMILAQGTRLGPAEIGIAAGNGNPRLPVRTRPRVALLSTGDELVPVDGSPGPCQVRDSNRIMLETAVTMLGGDLVHAAHLPDELEDTTRGLESAMDAAELVLSIGGVPCAVYKAHGGIQDFDDFRDLLIRGPQRSRCVLGVNRLQNVLALPNQFAATRFLGIPVRVMPLYGRYQCRRYYI